MGKSMRKFKKLAVLAITIPTLLSSTNISFAMQNIRNAKGPGSFQNIKRFFKTQLDNTTKANKDKLDILLTKYRKYDCMIILSLNYIRSFITLYTKDGFKNAFNSATVQEQMKKEAGERFKKITTNDESEILKVAVNVILYILNRNISKLNDQQQKKDCWASIKYVVNELDTSKIEQRKVKSDENDQLLYNFLLRGKDKISNRGKGFAVELIKKLQEQLNSEEYKCKYNGGDDSFGKFVFENSIALCTTHEDTYYDYPKFNSMSSNLSQVSESLNISNQQENMETQNTLNPQRQTIHIPLNQLYLDGQGRVLFNPNVPYDNTSGFITILNDFIYNNIQNIFIVNGLRHDKYGYIYYANGQPVLLPLQQQQFEAIPSEQYHYNTVDNSPFEQENMETQNTLNPQRQTIHIPLNQLSLDGQGNVLYNPTVPCDDTSGFIEIPKIFFARNCMEKIYVIGLFHDENGYIYNYNENECFTYANGQPVQLPLQQQSETITQGQYYYDTVDNSPFEQEEIQEQNEQVEDSKSPRQPESTKTGKTDRKRTREYIDCQNCGEEKCAQLNKTHNLKNGTTHKTYYCTKCKKCFTLDEKGNVIIRKTFEPIDCQNCGGEKCVRPNGTRTLRNGTKMQQYKCRECKKTFTQPINKNAEE